MAFMIELTFDAAADAAIREVWQALAEEIAPHMRDSGAAPHVSLAGYEGLDVAACRAALQQLAGELAPLDLTFSHFGVFIAPQPVVFVAPTVTDGLLDYHWQIHARCDSLGEALNPLYMPGRWIPHCTLAFNFEAGLIPRALAICQQLLLPLAARTKHLGVIEYYPVQTLAHERLRGVAN